MIRNAKKKVLVTALATSMLLPTLGSFTSPVKAASSTGSATTKSMINFFREDRTKLTVERTSPDEVKVYGVFLSNFYIPWSTKLGDLINNKAKNSFPKQISKKFFGSEDKNGQILDINEKVYGAIESTLKKSSSDFAMLKSSGSDKAMTGQEFFNKMTGKDKNKLIYGSNDNQIYFDLNDKAMKASIKTLFGISPSFMVSKKKGLRAMTGLYLDGFGNVWGSPAKKTALKDYVLVLPASLNPGVFPKTDDGFKYPMANVFSMGAVIKPDQNYLSSAPVYTPYYNLKSYLTDTKYDKGNALSIYGVQSASDMVGDTNSIIKNTNYASVSYNDVTSFINNKNQNVSGTKLKIILSVAPSKLSSVAESIEDEDSLGKKQIQNLVNYLFSGVALDYSRISDDMYYFKVPNASNENPYLKTSGDFSKVEDLIPQQRLFVEEGESSGSYDFYSDSYVASPFHNFLEGYKKSAKNKKDGYLKSKLPYYSGADSGVKTALKNFLETGNFKAKDTKTIYSALNVIRGKKPQHIANGSGNVYGVLPPSTSVGSVEKSSWGWFNQKTAPFGALLTSNDSILATVSTAFGNNRGYFNTDSVKYYAPFKYTEIGGLLSGTDGNFEPLKKGQQDRIKSLFYTGMSYRSFSMVDTFANALTGVASGAGNYATPWKNAKMVNQTAIMNGVNNFPGIYWGYVVSLLGVHPKSDGKGFEEPNPYSSPHLPDMDIDVLGGNLDLNEIFGEAGVVESEDKSFEEMQKDIVKKVYGLLSTKDSSYRDALIKSSQDSWVTSTHRAITGSWVNNELSVSSGGGGTYASSVGYINSPSIAELPLASFILQDYMYLYLFIFIIILAVIAMSVITSNRTFRQGVVMVLMMSVILLLPQFLVGNVINLTNSVSDKIFSEKFNFWAIAQHQQTNKKLSDATASGSEMQYIIASSMVSADAAYSKDAGVRVKWMSPKKDSMFDSIFTDSNGGETLAQNTMIFRWLFNSYLNDEEYNYTDPLATYVYRPYNAIARTAMESYSALNPTVLDRKSVVSKTIEAKKGVLGIEKDTFYLYGHPEGKVKFAKEQAKYISSVSAFKTGKKLNEVENYRYWGINNSEVTDAIFRSTYSENAGFTGNSSDKYYQAYSLLTESPFYYFYNTFKHRYALDGDFKSSLLNKKTFKINSSKFDMDQKIRDFMDMEGLFTYVVPYLNQGNQYVYGYTSLYGSDIAGYDFTQGEGTPTEKQKALKARFDSEKLKKQNMRNVWKLYTPWVDTLYNQDVRNIDVPIANKTVLVPDTLNPAMYQSVGRPMIFSEADMRAKNYTFGDLSTVEKKIIQTQKETYKDLMYLTNYYDFDDEVLITAAAMTATFNFNREFSENKVIGDSTVLYPQSYELKNFNYDAFMRLMLLNATGEPILSDDADGDLYQRIINKTSIFTGIILLATDVLGVIAIPAMKFATLICMFFLTIILAVSLVITPPERVVKTVFKHLGVPVLMYFGASVLFSLTISLFMGDGLSDYVGASSPELSITDPTVMMLALILIDCVYIFVLFKIIQWLFSSLKDHTMDSAVGMYASAVGTIGVVASKVTSGVTGAGSKVFNSFGGDSNTSVDATSGGGLSDGRGSSSGEVDNSFADTTARDNIGLGTSRNNANYDEEFNEDLYNKIDDLSTNGNYASRGNEAVMGLGGSPTGTHDQTAVSLEDGDTSESRPRRTSALDDVRDTLKSTVATRLNGDITEHLNETESKTRLAKSEKVDKNASYSRINQSGADGKE